MSIIKKQDVKSYLNITGNSRDNLIDSLIPQAEAFALASCNRNSFEHGEITEYFNGDSQSFLLSRIPVDMDQDFKIYVDYDRVFDEEHLLESDEYGVDPDAGIVQLDTRVSGGFRVVKIVYTGGYNVNEFPADLILGLVEMVAMKIKDGEGGELGVQSRSLPDGSVTFNRKDIPSTLEKYVI